MLSLSWSTFSATPSNPIELYTEIEPPFQYVESDRLKGLNINLMTTLFQRVSLPINIHALPWSRAYRYATSAPNIALFPTLRTNEREVQFVWVGPILESTYGLYKLKVRTDIQLETLDDARKYQTGVVIGDARYLYLLKKGFSEDAGSLSAVSEQVHNVQKLRTGRVDLIVMASLSCQTNEVDCGELQEAFRFNDFPNQLYLVFRKDSDPGLVLRLQQAFDGMIDDGTVARMLEEDGGMRKPEHELLPDNPPLEPPAERPRSYQ